MIKKVAIMGTAIAMVATGIGPAAAQFSTAIDVSKSTVAEAKASQQRIDSLDEETSRALVDYRANLKQYELLSRFNKSRAVEVDRQSTQIENLQLDVNNVENIQRAMLPMMEEMLATLEEFIAADMPFLEAERADRVARLRDVMTKSDVSEAQRDRLIIEAFQIENEYGRTIEAYPGTVATDSGELSVEFLRIGRVALIYKTADDSVLRIYDADSGAYVDLDKKYLADVRLGLRMAKEQTAPALLGVPVPAPTDFTAQ